MKLREKLLKGIDRTARVALAVSLTAVTVFTVWAGVTVYSNTYDEEKRPTLRFRCMDFTLLEDGSIQALVRISAENMPTFTGTGFNIQFNPYYIQPSYLTEVDGVQTQKLVTGDDESKGKHFAVDDALTQINAGGNYIYPFLTKGGEGYQLNEVTAGELNSDGSVKKNGTLNMYLKLDQNLRTNYTAERYENEDEDGKKFYTYDAVQTLSLTGKKPWEKNYKSYFLYMNAAGTVNSEGKDNYGYDETKKVGVGIPGTGLNIGSLTFWVDPDHLTDMVTKWDAKSDFLIGYPDGEGKDGWMISDLIEDPDGSGQYVPNVRKPEGQEDENQGPWGDKFTKEQAEENEQDWARVVFEFIFPQTLMKADVAGGDELTVNAYQAYGDGTIKDIADTLQRFRPEITGTCADATETNYVFRWGDASTTGDTPGCYKVYRPYVPGVDPAYDPTGDTPTGTKPDYIDRKVDTTLSLTEQQKHWWMEVTASDYKNNKMYKGDRKYVCTQYFYYEEGGEVKKYPLPMEVYLNVTPVELVDITADRLSATYSQAVANTFETSGLTPFQLPDEALLTLSPVPGPITLTMPLSATWTPKSIAALTVANGQAQDWRSAEATNVTAGTYSIKGPDTEAIKKYVEETSPWVTTDAFTGSIAAERTVLGEDAPEPLVNRIRYEAEYVSTEATGKLTIQVNKKDAEGAKEAFVNNAEKGLPRFRTYLPNGALIQDDETAGLPLGKTASNGAGSTATLPDQTVTESSSAELTYYPGTNTDDAPRSTHQEDVSRAINLGGWFYVSVCEEVEEGTSEAGGPVETEIWSDLIPVYVPPRINYYDPGDDAAYYGFGDETVDAHYKYDFTGKKAGLYPFYTDSDLPTNVVLPIGYTVTTTYDGLTGIEPGRLGQFDVKKWAAAAESTDAPVPTAPLWSGGDIVDYGDPGKPAAPPAAEVAADPTRPTDFKDMTYAGYGAVENHDAQGNTVDHDAVGLEQVRMRVQVAPDVTPKPTPTPDPLPDPPLPTPTPEPAKQPEESVKLIHEGSTRFKSDKASGVTKDANGEVTKVTYTLRQEGYVVRQTYTLTLENDGDTDIYGLSVDIVNGAHKPEDDGFANHFELLSQPSAYLPAGGKTTFTITYVYNLTDENPDSAKGTTYEDHILIFSNGYHDPASPLKEFIADFEVTKDELYHVTVVTRPEGDGTPEKPDMGTAGIVTPPKVVPTVPDNAADGAAFPAYGEDSKLSLSAAADDYVSDYKYVWIHADPNDEYKVKKVYYIDGYQADGVTEIEKPLYIHEWSEKDGDPVEETDYFFKMPAKDVTVVVEFYEPILSKLRLSRLMGYAGTTTQAPNQTGNLVDISADEAVDPAEITVPSKRHNVRWYDDTFEVIQDDPAYRDKPTDTIYNMSPEDSSRPGRPEYKADYLMVLGDYTNTEEGQVAEDDLTRVQLRLRLRENFLSPNIDDVSVALYEYDMVNETRSSTALNPPDVKGQTWHEVTGAPTSHDSYVFDAPVSENGEPAFKAVEIVLSTKVTQDMVEADPTLQKGDIGSQLERSFIVAIARTGKEITSELNYGNSPKGMIYNDTTLTTEEARSKAWKAFVDNDSAFAGGSTPVKAKDLTNVYWKEAWGGVTYPDAEGKLESYNGDEDEYALFLLLGQPFQDPGFKTLKNTLGFDVDPKNVQRTVTVDQLNTSDAATTQALRFNGLRGDDKGLIQATLDLGVGDKGLVTSTTAGDVIDKWWQIVATDDGGGETTTVYNVRPGLYTLTYTFPDYDGKTMKTTTRPIIILSQVGDVNADREVVNGKETLAQGEERLPSDVDYLKNRVTDPLGGMMTPNANAANAVPDYPHWRLFRYRCCDVNNDRNINHIDANYLGNAKEKIAAYYRPTDYISK